MVAALKILIDIFGEPSTGFKALKTHPKWLTAFVIICLVSIGVAWAMMPFSQQIVHAKIIASGVDDAQIEQALAIVDRFSFVGLFFTPAPLLLKWVLFAGLLYFASATIIPSTMS